MTEKSFFYKDLLNDHLKAMDCPSPNLIHSFFEDLVSYLFPDYGEIRLTTIEAIEEAYKSLHNRWLSIVEERCQKLNVMYPGKPEDLFDALVEIRLLLLKDIEAIYEGDPAAKSHVEIIKTYPGFKAIAAYRIANCLYNAGYVLIARMISEYAHTKTGVDIHPGATIGEYFCIDHATGIVVGETSTIGHHVKIYQGVTLGATSVNKSDASKKRHPTIGNYVVIYSNATILGGKTHIGDHSTVGGNSWITKSVPAYSKLYYDSQNKHLQRTEQ